MSISKQFNKNIEFLSTQNIVGNSGGSVYIAGGLNIQDLNVSNTVTIANLTITNSLSTSNGNTFISSPWIKVPSGISYTSSNYNVGIQTTSPSFNLDVSGGARITESLTTGSLNTVIGASIPNLLCSVIVSNNLYASNINTNNLFIPNTIASTGITTGALVISGGVGIGGNLYTEKIYSNATITVPGGSSGIGGLTLNTNSQVYSTGIGTSGNLFLWWRCYKNSWKFT